MMTRTATATKRPTTTTTPTTTGTATPDLAALQRRVEELETTLNAVTSVPIIRSALAFCEMSQRTSEQHTRATREWQAQYDKAAPQRAQHVADFAREALAAIPDAAVSVGAVADAYLAWCGSRSIHRHEIFRDRDGVTQASELIDALLAVEVGARRELVASGNGTIDAIAGVRLLAAGDSRRQVEQDDAAERAARDELRRADREEDQRRADLQARIAKNWAERQGLVSKPE